MSDSSYSDELFDAISVMFSDGAMPGVAYDEDCDKELAFRVRAANKACIFTDAEDMFNSKYFITDVL